MARTYVLGPFEELRIVTHDSYLNVPIHPTIRLLNTPAPAAELIPNQRGAAEIYGRELVSDVDFAVDEGERIAVFTWVGCSIQVKGMVVQEYQGSDHPMKEYLNIMHAINAERELAAVNKEQGPRILITGSPSSGKSSVAMLLCNYAVRNGWTPLFVEADPRASTDKKPLQFYPGTIGASVISKVSEDPPDNPLVYLYGYNDVKEHEKLYLQVSQAMAATVELMMEEALERQPYTRRSDESNDAGKYIASSGIIINAPYSANKNQIVKLAKIYNVSTILVIDSLSMHQDLVCTFAEMAPGKTKKVAEDMEPEVLGNLAFTVPSGVTMSTDEDKEEEPAEQPPKEPEPTTAEKKPKETLVLAVNKLSGVVSVDNERIKYLHARSWRRYFDLSSGEMHVIKIQLETVKLVYIETSASLSKDALPTDEVGWTNRDEMYASPWNGDPVSLTNSVLSIPATDDLKLIPYCNIKGFLLVKSVEISDVVQGSNDGNDAVQPNVDTEDAALDRVETTYILDVICPSIYSPSGLPPYLVVAGNIRSMKLQSL